MPRLSTIRRTDSPTLLLFAIIILVTILLFQFSFCDSTPEECDTGGAHTDCPAVSPSRISKLENLLLWSQARGLRLHKDIGIGKSTLAGFGLFAREPIASGEVFLSFPIELVIGAPTLRLDPNLAFLDSLDLVSLSSNSHQILAIVALFYAVGKRDPVGEGDDSSPYFDSFPSHDSCESPLCMTETELGLLEDLSDVYHVILKQRHDVEEMFQKSKSLVFDLYPEIFPPELVTYERYVHAYHAARTRALSLDFAKIAGFGSAQEDNLSDPSEEEEGPKEEEVGVPEEEERYSTFVPVADLLNFDFHMKDTETVRAAFNAMTYVENGTRLELSAHRDFEEGEEILAGFYPAYIPTSRWFVRYGNVPKDEMYDDSVCLGREHENGGHLKLCLSPRKICSDIEYEYLSTYLSFRETAGSPLEDHTGVIVMRELLKEIEGRYRAIILSELIARAEAIGTANADAIRRLLVFEKEQFGVLGDCLREILFPFEDYI